MAASTELQGRIARLFGEKLNVEVPSIDMDLYETGVLDSMAFVELLAFLEKEFEVRVGLNDLEIDNFRTIRKIVKFVLERNRVEETA
jgi:D-alanine--poly(phosphoribitol) ligase subunit 2